MSKDIIENLVLVTCSILEKEVRMLIKEHWQKCSIISVSSLFHMKPNILNQNLKDILQEQIRLGSKIVLIYGDCCPEMLEFGKNSNIVRVAPYNCISLLLGSEEYSRFIHDGAFFLLPEWTKRWRDIFTDGLGLNKNNASDLLKDMHRFLVYIDTGIEPVPNKELAECAEYCGLPAIKHPITLNCLRISIEAAMDKLY